MSEMKTITFPGDKEPREIVDAKARKIIGNMSQLETADKSSLVAAINEAAKSGGSSDSAQNPIHAAATAYDLNVHSVNHRGYSASAPENTIPAYIKSKEMGFTYVEADVSFTSDGVAVLLHDSTIARTSNGSGSISAMTYAEASKYDYGSWKSTAYTGTRIPTFEEFIILCKRIGLHPYIELKQHGAYTQEQIQSLVSMVKNCGMAGKVTWISFAPSYLEYVKSADPSARLGYLVSSVTDAVITTAQGLQTDTNEVFLDSSDYDADAVSLCQAAGLPLEIWTINTASTIKNMDAYITGVTSDNLIAGKILRDAGMVYEYGINGEDVHTHSYTATVTTAATCTTAGVRTYTCSCGNSYTESIPATGHKYADGICSVCGATHPNVEDGLLYGWDFSNGNMTDYVQGVVASHNVVQVGNGMSFTDNGGYIKLGEFSYNMQNKTVEIDVAQMVGGSATDQYGRLFCIASKNTTETVANTAAFLWGQNKRGWTFYGGTQWSGTHYNSGTLARDFFNGKTVQLYFDNDMYCELIVDGVSYGKPSVPSEYTDGWLLIGGSFNDYLYAMQTVVSGVRIYEGRKTG